MRRRPKGCLFKLVPAPWLQLLTGVFAMCRRIGIPKHVEMAEALLGEL